MSGPFGSSSFNHLISSGFYNGVATQSLRFDDGSTHYLTRTPSADGNKKTYTFSGWIKRGVLGIEASIFNCDLYPFAPVHNLRFHDDDTLRYYWGDGGTAGSESGGVEISGDRLFRDTSSWYNIVANFDSTQSTKTDRIRIYINGERQTLTGFYNGPHGDHYPTQNYESANANMNEEDTPMIFGAMGNNTTSDAANVVRLFDGYMAEINYLDGAYLDASSFGETKNGVWIPIDTSGLTFGTNGCRLKFANTGTGTASSSTIGADTSGNNNHFTSVNLAASDSNLPDSPENNYCTLSRFRAVTANTISDGNLKVVTSSAGRSYNAGSFLMKRDTGKWWWEFRVSGNGGGMGVARVNATDGSGAFQSVTSTSTGNTTTDYYYGANNWGVYGHQIAHNGSIAVTLSGSASYAQIYGVLLDTDSSSPNMAIYQGGSAVGNIDLDTGYDFIPIAGDGTGAVSYTIEINFGQDPTFAGSETAGSNTDTNGEGLFSQAVPTGAKALCAVNLSDTTIGPNSDTQADDHFETLLYTSANPGAGGTQNITTGNFQPDWVWLKNRDGTSTEHTLYDSSRGAERHVPSDTAAAERVTSIYGYLSSFNSNGFTLTGGTTNANYVAQGTQKYVAWTWKANGGTTTTNDASATSIGTIDSTIQANDDAGFSIVLYEGTGSAGSIKHGLSDTPDMIILINRDQGRERTVFHSANGRLGQQYLSTNGAFSDNSGSFNDTAPTSSVFTVNTDQVTNESGQSFVAYCFRDIEGYQKFGSYIGNGNADGPYIYTGFRPKFVFLKNRDSTDNWSMYDSSRDIDNPVAEYIIPNSAEASGTTNSMDFNSNGFKVLNAGNYINTDGHDYLYWAIADTPFKYANAR